MYWKKNYQSLTGQYLFYELYNTNGGHENIFLTFQYDGYN